jgi:hypothetical protein
LYDIGILISALAVGAGANGPEPKAISARETPPRKAGLRGLD